MRQLFSHMSNTLYGEGTSSKSLSSCGSSSFCFNSSSNFQKNFLEAENGSGGNSQPAGAGTTSTPGNLECRANNRNFMDDSKRSLYSLGYASTSSFSSSSPPNKFTSENILARDTLCSSSYLNSGGRGIAGLFVENTFIEQKQSYFPPEQQRISTALQSQPQPPTSYFEQKINATNDIAAYSNHQYSYAGDTVACNNTNNNFNENNLFCNHAVPNSLENHNSKDLASSLDKMLNELEGRFSGLSNVIINRIDDMNTQIEALEKSLDDIICDVATYTEANSSIINNDKKSDKENTNMKVL